jgi:hypothetical protein
VPTAGESICIYCQSAFAGACDFITNPDFDQSKKILDSFGAVYTTPLRGGMPVFKTVSCPRREEVAG